MAKAVFGACVTSLSSAQFAIDKELGEKTAVLFDSKNTFSNKKILLVPNVNALRANSKMLSKFKGTLIVFDSPLNLHSIKNLHWLDVKRNVDSLSYKFDFVPAKYSELFDKYKSKESKPIKIRKLDVLQSLVNSRSDTFFLERWNNFVYFCTSHANREIIKVLLIEYFDGKLSLSALNTKWAEHLRSDQVENYRKEFVGWLKSADGAKLLQGWKQFREGQEYAKVCKKLEIELPDMKYLVKLAKTVKGDKNGT
ncbi:MAG: hypothetical protein KGH75_01440 [Rhodospirillales bacterium]|nr:hypothetical protein [Rhodospirillales bacterium]